VVALPRAPQPTPPSQITLERPYSPQRFHLNYSEREWNRVNTIIKFAEKAIREDHKKRHELLTLPHAMTECLCRVTTTDIKGGGHIAEVKASSLYEAIAAVTSPRTDSVRSKCSSTNLRQSTR
jgi:hypothetical protein